MANYCYKCGGLILEDGTHTYNNDCPQFIRIPSNPDLESIKQELQDLRKRVKALEDKLNE